MGRIYVNFMRKTLAFPCFIAGMVLEQTRGNLGNGNCPCLSLRQDNITKFSNFQEIRYYFAFMAEGYHMYNVAFVHCFTPF